MENKINATEEVDSLVKRSLKCLDAYANYTQEQIDYIVAKASVAALSIKYNPWVRQQQQLLHKRFLPLRQNIFVH